MINTNLPPILHRLGVLAFQIRNRYISLPLLRLNLPTKRFPWDDLRKVFCGCQWMAKVPNGEETLPKISTGWVGRTNVTDRRQTDRQTDGRAIAYNEREREFTFAKKSMLDSQVESLPVNPGGQLQVNPFTWSAHIPPCWHGLLAHSLMSVSQRAPVKQTVYLKHNNLMEQK